MHPGQYNNNANVQISLGLCCINTILRAQKPPIFCSRTCIRRTYSVERAQSMALQNIRDIIPMIDWNEKHKIRCFRLSSNIFPHFTDSQTESYTIDFAKSDLQKTGNIANNYKHRIVMHPGQYNNIGAKNRDIFENTVKDLSHHASILDCMNIDQDGVLIIHGGGLYGDKESTIRRWLEQYDDLPQNVKDRLVLENCEKSFSAEDCLDISQEISIPIVFDFHHYNCYSILHPQIIQVPILELLPAIVDTWVQKNKTPLMHISEQGTGKIGHHSDFVEKIPSRLIEYLKDNPNIHVDLEVEAKMKEQAIFRLRQKYPDIVC